MVKQCSFCGKDFEPTNNKQIYCDRKCYWEGHAKEARRKLRKVYKRKCKFCGTEYETTDRRKIYCSNECKIKWHIAKIPTPHKGKKGICAVCGKEFTVSRNPTKNGELDFTPYGGLKDPASTGGTGDILFTTIGHTSGDSYTIILDIGI